MIIEDFKYAVRLLAKKPGFTLLTTSVMAVGIGLSVYLFSFFNTVNFKPLPFKDGASLVVLNSYEKQVDGYGQPLNLHDYYEIRTTVKGLSEFGAYRDQTLNVSGRDGARRYRATFAEPNIFQITRIRPLSGRGFTDADNQKGAERVTVIGYDMWQNQFAGDPLILEQTLRVLGEIHRIIGVMPQGYSFPSRSEMWLPMREDATRMQRGEANAYYGLAHLNGDLTREEIDLQLAVIAQRIEERYPETNNNISAYVGRMQGITAPRGSDPFIYSMHVVTILVLVLASINVGNLLFSRAVERGKETAIRVALGAPRTRLISQMLWESIIICSVGGLVGLLLVAWGLEITGPVTASFFSVRPPFWWQFGLDSYTVGLAIAFIAGSVLVTGLFPAWKNSGADFNAVLRDGTRGALGKKAGRLNRALVVSEIFLSMAIMIAAGVIILTTYFESFEDYGAETENLLTADVLLSETVYDTPLKQVTIIKKIQLALENNGGIGDVIITSALPSYGAETPTIAIEGNEYISGGVGVYPRANYIALTEGSLRKLGVELRHGRYFNSSDHGLTKSTAIVTDSFANRHFPDSSPIGKRLRIVEHDGDVPNWISIVGVVEHTMQGSPNSDRAKFPSIFRPYSQAPQLEMAIAMKMKAAAPDIVRNLRQSFQSIDPDLPIYNIGVFAEKLRINGGPSRFISTLFLLFGIAAVILASSGIYGVMSNTINQRSQEIGVKRALGAQEQRVTREYLLKGFKQLLWGGIPGLLAGCGLAFSMSQSSETLSLVLPIIAAVVVTVVTSVVMLATYLPTKRVLKMEPSEALHYE